MAATRVQARRGTTAQWEAADPVLAAGEWGAAIDNGVVVSLRIGTGTSHWTDLPDQSGVTVHWSTEPPTPGDGAVGDLWVVIAP